MQPAKKGATKKAVQKPAGPKKRLIGGVFPKLFWLNIGLSALFMLAVENLFLGVVIFWPIGHFVCLMFTMNEIRSLPIEEKRAYLALIHKDKPVGTIKGTRSKAIKR